MSKSAEGLDALRAMAGAARARAYAPYSNYQVGAALRTASGRYYSGCNVENSAYPEGTCAEAGAIAQMVLAGDRTIAEVVVVGPPGRPCTPCGGCRQKIREFAGPHTPVHVCNPYELLLTTTIGELLPVAFGPEHVGLSADDG
ncbi:MAG: cytidine deaminase [Gammaproteobacteria bacterium]|nr:cytidine deaminase [Gammaproteobacteria bacterium]